MSHEIHAYSAKDNDEFPTEIAYFKRTAFDSLNKTSYSTVKIYVVIIVVSIKTGFSVEHRL